MEGLIGALALVIGTLLAVGGSMVGLRLLISFVPGPSSDDTGSARSAPSDVDDVPIPSRS